MIDISKHKWKLLIIISTIGLGVDILTKHLAAVNLQKYIPFTVIGDLLQFQLTYNKGFIFGLNPQNIFPSFPVNVIFVILSACAMVLLIVYYINIETQAKAAYWAIAIIMPGALGNMFDRIVRPGQGVVDFIKVDLNFPPFNPWPIFNMADIYISVGVGLMLFDMLFLEGKRKKAQIVAVVQKTESDEIGEDKPSTETGSAS